jgi:hypothetical protein
MSQAKESRMCEKYPTEGLCCRTFSILFAVFIALLIAYCLAITFSDPLETGLQQDFRYIFFILLSLLAGFLSYVLFRVAGRWVFAAIIGFFGGFLGLILWDGIQLVSFVDGKVNFHFVCLDQGHFSAAIFGGAIALIIKGVMMINKRRISHAG